MGEGQKSNPQCIHRTGCVYVTACIQAGRCVSTLTEVKSTNQGAFKVYICDEHRESRTDVCLYCEIERLRPMAESWESYEAAHDRKSSGDETTGWRPIATAPSDGNFLVALETCPHLSWPAHAGDGHIYSNAHGVLNEADEHQRVTRATHWHPSLPAPASSVETKVLGCVWRDGCKNHRLCDEMGCCQAL